MNNIGITVLCHTILLCKEVVLFSDETDFALFAGIGESRVLSGTNKQAPVNYNIELRK